MTIRALDLCIGLPGQGSTYMLGANIETASGQLLQLGYGQIAGPTGRRFYLVHGSPSAVEWPHNYLPVVGDRYRFTITRVVEPDGSADANYKIQDFDAGTSSTVTYDGWY